MSLFEGLSIIAYYLQLMVIGGGLWLMNRAATQRSKQLDQQHEENMAAIRQQGEELKGLNEKSARLYETNIRQHEENMAAIRQQGEELRSINEGIREQSAALRSIGEGIREQSAALRSVSEGIREQSAGIREQSAGIRALLEQAA